MVQRVHVGRYFLLVGVHLSTTYFWKHQIGIYFTHIHTYTHTHTHTHTQLPIYYFNHQSCREVAENDTYCEFTVQFQIKLHGMGMGAISVVGTLLVRDQIYVCYIHTQL